MNSPTIQVLHDTLLEEAGVKAAVLRLDQIHPIVSGNKIFKLKPYIDLARQKNVKQVISFGGAHSNHLVAMAYACKEAGLKCKGMVRGEKSANPSSALIDCITYGMEIEYVERSIFKEKTTLYASFQNEETLVIPEGGYGKLGMIGASAIMELEGVKNFNTILASCGTGTMGAGLIYASNPKQYIHLVSALKNNASAKKEMSDVLSYEPTNAMIHFGYDMGGYAKTSKQLIAFMNELYKKHKIPTDIVYTGKLFYAFYQMLEKNQFEKGSSILIIHSGGLQGNRSLGNGVLEF